MSTTKVPITFTIHAFYDYIATHQFCTASMRMDPAFNTHVELAMIDGRQRLRIKQDVHLEFTFESLKLTLPPQLKKQNIAVLAPAVYRPVGIAFTQTGALGLAPASIQINFGRVEMDAHKMTVFNVYPGTSGPALYEFSVILQRIGSFGVGIIDPGIENIEEDPV